MSEFELNVPEASESDFPDTVWIDHGVEVKEVGDSLSFSFDRLNIGEKAVSAFNDENGISFFIVSEYEGETLGERFLIATAKALDFEGKVNASEVVIAVNDRKEPLTLTIKLQGFKTEDGESRTYKRITVK